MTDKITWTDDFSVGHDLMDAQHRSLVNIFNTLVDNGDCRSSFHLTLNDLTEYARYHFDQEERLLAHCLSADELASHREEHMEYLDHIAESCVNAAMQLEDIDKTILFLKKWWSDHILISDKNIMKRVN